MNHDNLWRGGILTNHEILIHTPYCSCSKESLFLLSHICIRCITIIKCKERAMKAQLLMMRMLTNNMKIIPNYKENLSVKVLLIYSSVQRLEISFLVNPNLPPNKDIRLNYFSRYSKVFQLLCDIVILNYPNNRNKKVFDFSWTLIETVTNKRIWRRDILSRCYCCLKMEPLS